MLTFDVLYLIYLVVYRIYIFTLNYMEFKYKAYMLLTDLIPGIGSELTHLLIYFVIGCFFIIVGSIFKQLLFLKMRMI